MPVVPGASVPCPLHDVDAFLLVNDSDKQKEQLKLPARVYCFALSQLLAHHLQHRIEPSEQEDFLCLKVLNPANNPDYDKHAGQAAKFYWGTVNKKLCIAKWVLTVNFNPSKDFNDQPCTLENWTCRKSFRGENSFQVFGCKRSLDVRRLLYMLQHPLNDFDKLFPVLERAEKFLTRFDDVIQGGEPWISEWAKE